MERDYLLALLWAAVLGASILIWPVPNGDRRPLLVVWGVKCAVALGLMLVYEWNYPLDAYAYFLDAASRQGSVPEGFGELGAGNENIVGAASILSAIVPDSYHALKISFAMIGLLAIYGFYRASVRFLGREDHRILYVVGLFPSILFWSSIVGKDPLQLIGIAAYAYGVVSWTRTGSWRFVAIGAVGIIVAASIRIWIAPILLAPIAVVLLRRGGHLARRAVVGAAALIALSWAWSQFADRFRLETTADLVVAAGSLSQGWEGGSATLQGVTGFTDVQSMIRFAPIGMFTVLFRPLPGEVRNAFGTGAGLENALLLVLLVRAIRRADRSRFRDPIVWWAILLIIIWALVYAFIAYNLGAIVRFKLQILPILLLLLMHLGTSARAKGTGNVPPIGAA